MNRQATVSVALVLLLGLASCSSEPKIAPVEGIWMGSLKYVGIENRILFNIYQLTDGRLGGTVLRPDEADEEIYLTNVTFSEGRLHIDIATLNAMFDGHVAGGGAQLEGYWRDPAFPQPLTLTRIPAVPSFRKPQDPVPPFPYDEEGVRYDNPDGSATLAGTLTLPRAGHPVPAVILISGGGPQNRDGLMLGHRPFKVMADHLTRQGIAVLRVDDRGVGGSTGDRSRATTADYAGDVLAGVEFLKGRKEIDPTKIGLIGHSEGGTIAPIAASRSGDVAFIVMMAAVGLPGDQYNIQFEESIARSSGLSEEVIASKRAIQESVFAVLKKDEPDSILRVELSDLLAGLEPPLPEARIPSTVDWYLSPWFRFTILYDPAPTLRRVKCPVLAIYGEKDVQVPPDRNAEGIEAALKKGRNKDYQVEVLPGLNHLFQTAETGAPAEYSKIEETLSPVVLERIATWILEHTE
jgi:pimeloyl-ACP methyl ester carboxylesterase